MFIEISIAFFCVGVNRLGRNILQMIANYISMAAKEKMRERKRKIH